MGRESCASGLALPACLGTSLLPRVTQLFLPCGGGCDRGSLHHPAGEGLHWPHSYLALSLSRGQVRGFPLPPHPPTIPMSPQPFAAPAPAQPVAQSRRDVLLCTPLSGAGSNPATPCPFWPAYSSPLSGTLNQSWMPLTVLTHPLISPSGEVISHCTTACHLRGCLGWKLSFPGCFSKGNRFISFIPLSFPTSWERAHLRCHVCCQPDHQCEVPAWAHPGTS